VLTDLFNFAMPLVRYDTGDLGIIERDAGNLYLSRVEGRKLDILFDTKGNVVSSYIMYKNMWQYTEIDQYQLIQTGEKTYLFKINCPGKFKREEQLVNEFLCYLGNDAEFKVEYVNEIPLLDSGKRRKTVNLYKKTI
jgi:phenylacetate-CoA ligase